MSVALRHPRSFSRRQFTTSRNGHWQCETCHASRLVLCSLRMRAYRILSLPGRRTIHHVLTSRSNAATRRSDHEHFYLRLRLQPHRPTRRHRRTRTLGLCASTHHAGAQMAVSGNGRQTVYCSGGPGAVGARDDRGFGVSVKGVA